jgi:hypothetical protein
MKLITATSLLFCLVFLGCAEKGTFKCDCEIVDNTATPPDTTQRSFTYDNMTEPDAANACTVRENELGTGSYYDAVCSLRQI